MKDFDILLTGTKEYRAPGRDYQPTYSAAEMLRDRTIDPLRVSTGYANPRKETKRLRPAVNAAPRTPARQAPTVPQLTTRRVSIARICGDKSQTLDEICEQLGKTEPSARDSVCASVVSMEGQYWLATCGDNPTRFFLTDLGRDELLGPSMADKVYAYIQTHPDCTSVDVRKRIMRSQAFTRKAINDLIAAGRVYVSGHRKLPHGHTTLRVDLFRIMP